MLLNRGDITSDYIYTSDGELYHYGVIGMKWGVRRALYKTKQNKRLANKAAKYDKKKEQLYKKSEKVHSEKDLEAVNKAAKKASQYGKKAASIERKINKETDEVAKATLNKKYESLKYKSEKQRAKANTLSRITGYNAKAQKYAMKSDKAAINAAKLRKKIATNEFYIEKTKQKASTITAEEREKGYAFVQTLLN